MRAIDDAKELGRILRPEGHAPARKERTRHADHSRAGRNIWAALGGLCLYSREEEIWRR